MYAEASKATEATLIRKMLASLPRSNWTRLLDLALAATVVLLLRTDATVFLFHVIFILLTIGAFFWKIRAFAIRASIWVLVTSLIVANAVFSRQTPFEELGEIPLLTIILLVVFGIARQRAKAEDALRRTNAELECRVKDRTAELTKVNAELTGEVAQHKQTSEVLQQSEERYRRLVELSFEAIAIHSDGVLVYINPSGAELLGAADPHELIGTPIRDLIHPDFWDLVQARVHQAKQEGRGVPLVEEKLLRLDGISVDVETAAVPITYQGQPAVQVVIRDLTARRQAEEERQRERRRIARDLHDSLGHSLGFLHLKLDQLLDVDDLGNTTKVRQELSQMRVVTSDAYKLVRDMLATFLPTNAADLSAALLTLARATGKKADFDVRFTSEGQSRALPPITQQQTLYLFKEALNNVAKHADAHQVQIGLQWAPETLTIALADDGCGFQTDDPQIKQSEGHFGLAIMQERATETCGDLTVNSQPGVGTEVILRLPLKPISERVMEL